MASSQQSEARARRRYAAKRIGVECLHFAVTLAITLLFVFLLFWIAPNRATSQRPWQVPWMYSTTQGQLHGSEVWGWTAKTAMLTVGASFITFLYAVPVAVLLARRRASLVARPLNWLAYCLSIIPLFVTGFVLLYFFSVRPREVTLDYWGIVRPFVTWREQTLGLSATSQKVQGFAWQSYLIPWIVLGLGNGSLATIIRALKTELERLFASDYVLAARARGDCATFHVLRAGAPALVAILSERVVELLGGAIIIEKVFQVYGLGECCLVAAKERDFYLALTVVTIMVCIYQVYRFLNLALSIWLDRRDPELANPDTR